MSAAVAIVQPSAAPSADCHIPAAAAIRRHPSLSRVRLYRLVAGGEVRVVLPPGRPPRYNVADLDRVMADRG